MIESSSNVQIKHIQKLKKSARYRKKNQSFLVEGWKMVHEALKCGLVQQIYLSASAGTTEMAKEVQKHQTVEFVSAKLFADISDTKTPQGILAVVTMPEYKIEDYIEKSDVSFLCLEAINDPGNLGTMIRTAEGAGMTGVILSKDSVDLFHPKVVRATMGSMFRVPFFVTDEFVDFMHLLQKKKFKLYAAHLNGTSSYTEVSYQGKIGILIGNEANGLTDEVAETADWKVKIPMKGELESLNASVSAALFMYEMLRRKEERK